MDRSQNGFRIIADGNGHFQCWDVIRIPIERIFDFFRYEFNTRENVKNEYGYRSNEIEHLRALYPREKHNVEEDEFFQEYGVRERNGCVLDALAGTTYIDKLIEFGFKMVNVFAPQFSH